MSTKYTRLAVSHPDSAVREVPAKSGEGRGGSPGAPPAPRIAQGTSGLGRTLFRRGPLSVMSRSGVDQCSQVTVALLIPGARRIASSPCGRLQDDIGNPLLSSPCSQANGGRGNDPLVGRKGIAGRLESDVDLDRLVLGDEAGRVPPNTCLHSTIAGSSTSAFSAILVTSFSSSVSHLSPFSSSPGSS